MASSSFSAVKKEDDETSSKSSGSTKRCPFCKRDILEQDSLIFGQAEVSENYTVHYFCVLLATQLLQRGDDDDGIKGFLHADIQREIRRARKTRCCYCNAKGATVSCASPSCRRVFHFPCGFEAGAVPDFGSESFAVLCGEHFRLQRRRQEQKQRREKHQQREAARSTSLLDDDDNNNNNGDDDNDDDNNNNGDDDNGEYGTPECLVCLSRVDVDLRHGGPLPPDLFISPCCRQIYEKNCLRGYAGVAGLHHFKCSQCRNADEFVRACQREGIFVPDQDAEWERTGDFADHYVPHSTCDVLACLRPQGRATVNGHPDWEVVRCDDCGKSGTHIKCSNLQEGPHSPYQCNDCSLVGNDSSVSCPTASASQVNSGNVRWYIESRLHEAFPSEDIVILQQEDDGNTEDVDIDDSNAVRADNKENKVATKASPVVPDFSAVSLKWCKTEATSQDDGRPQDTTAQTSNAISLVRHHTAEALDCASTPCTPSKSPSRALRQLTLHSFASPVKPYSTESDRPAALDTRSSEQVCSTRVTSPRRKAAARSKAARRSIFSWSSSSSFTSSPVKKKIRRQKLQKGQTTLDGFFRSPLAMFGALRSSLGFAASSAVDNNNDDDDEEEEEDDKKFDLKICASSVDEQRQHRHSADVVARANKNGSRSSGQPSSRQPNHPAAVGIDVTTRNNCTSNSNRTKLLAVKLEPGYSW